jgi:hypothetical protein
MRSISLTREPSVSRLDIEQERSISLPFPSLSSLCSLRSSSRHFCSFVPVVVFLSGRIVQQFDQMKSSTLVSLSFSLVNIVIFEIEGCIFFLHQTQTRDIEDRRRDMTLKIEPESKEAASKESEKEP